jgi:hypothetical protein
LQSLSPSIQSILEESSHSKGLLLVRVMLDMLMLLLLLLLQLLLNHWMEHCCLLVKLQLMLRGCSRSHKLEVVPELGSRDVGMS